MVTLDFNGKLADKRRREEFEDGKRLMLQLLADATPAEQKEIFASIEARDLDRYKAVTEPIVKRHVIRELNTKGGENT